MCGGVAEFVILEPDVAHGVISRAVWLLPPPAVLLFFIWREERKRALKEDVLSLGSGPIKGIPKAMVI